MKQMWELLIDILIEFFLEVTFGRLTAEAIRPHPEISDPPTSSPQPGTFNHELRTANYELRTTNCELRTNPCQPFYTLPSLIKKALSKVYTILKGNEL